MILQFLCFVQTDVISAYIHCAGIMLFAMSSNKSQLADSTLSSHAKVISRPLSRVRMVVPELPRTLDSAVNCNGRKAVESSAILAMKSRMQNLPKQKNTVVRPQSASNTHNHRTFIELPLSNLEIDCKLLSRIRTHPIGAHRSASRKGSKTSETIIRDLNKKLQENKPNPTLATASTKIDEQPSSRDADSVFGTARTEDRPRPSTSPAGYSRQSMSFSAHSRLRGSTVGGESADYVRIELHLSVLTDHDGNREKTVEAASHLIKMTKIVTEPPIYQAFYESGMMPVLLAILDRDTWPELIASACVLLRFITQNNRILH